MSDYIQVGGGDTTVVANTEYANYSGDLVLPHDLHLHSSVLPGSLSDSFPNNGTYELWDANQTVYDDANQTYPDYLDYLFTKYNFGGIDWYGAGTAVISGGQVSCHPTSPFALHNSGPPDFNPWQPLALFSLQAAAGIHSDDQYVQCQIASVRTGQTMSSIYDTTFVSLATRTSAFFGGGSGGFAVVATFVQSGGGLSSPMVIVTTVDDPFFQNAAQRVANPRNLFENFPVNGYVAWTGGIPNNVLGSGGGGPTLAPGDIIRLEVVQTNFDVLVNGASVLSGTLATFPGITYPAGTMGTGAYPEPNTIGGDSCGLLVRDDFNSGTGFLSIQNFSCGSLGDPRTAGKNQQRTMPIAVTSDHTITATPIDVHDSVKLDTPDTVAVASVYSCTSRLKDSPFTNLGGFGVRVGGFVTTTISSCGIDNYAYFLTITRPMRVEDPHFAADWGTLALYRYDTVGNTWAQMAAPPIPTLGGPVYPGPSISPAVARGVLGAYNGLIYLVCTSPADSSRPFSGFSSDAESYSFVYTPNIDSWSPLTPMPLEYSDSYGDGTFSVARGQGVIVNGKFYFPGGEDNLADPVHSERSQSTRRFAVYDINSDTWANETPLPYARGDSAVVALGTDIYMIGGISDSVYDSTIGKYDTINQTWTLRSTHGEATAAPNRENGLVTFDPPAVVYGNRIFTYGFGNALLVDPDGSFQPSQTNPGSQSLGNTIVPIGDFWYTPLGDEQNPYKFGKIDPKKLPWVI